MCREIKKAPARAGAEERHLAARQNLFSCVHPRQKTVVPDGFVLVEPITPPYIIIIADVRAWGQQVLGTAQRGWHQEKELDRCTFASNSCSLVT